MKLDDDEIRGEALLLDVLSGLEDLLEDEPDMKQLITQERTGDYYD